MLGDGALAPPEPQSAAKAETDGSPSRTLKSVIQLYGLKCPGCDQEFAARVGVEPTKMTRFYVPCLHCEYPIKARMFGEDLGHFRVEFDASVVAIGGEALDRPFVTVDPTVPSRHNGAERGQLGTFPTMTLLHLAGDEGVELIQVLQQGKDAASARWPIVRRLFEFYLAENWTLFDKAAVEAYADWKTVDTEHERATFAHQAVGELMAAVSGPRSEAAAMFIRRLGMKHTAALNHRAYREELHALAKSGELASLQRQVFDEIGRFVESLPSWQMGILDRYVSGEARSELADLTLFRDEFDTLRDRYQQSYELVCKVIKIALAAQNTVIRKNPTDFGPVPAAIGIKTSPTTLAKFDRLSTAHRLQYLRQVPRWEGFADLMNNKKRNAIGHASARHDLLTGRIISDVYPSGVSYLEVCADVFGMFDALGASLQVLRWARIATSRDFKYNQLHHP